MKKIATATLSLFFAFAANAHETTKNNKATEEKTKGRQKTPEYPGGLKELFNFISQNAQRAISYRAGSMVVTFMVSEDGSLSEIETAQGISPKFDEKVRDIIAKSSNWIPGEQDGEKVKVKYNLPLHFN
jgi:outer membrane biosynthesis protein TonB